MLKPHYEENLTKDLDKLSLKQGWLAANCSFVCNGLCGLSPYQRHCRALCLHSCLCPCPFGQTYFLCCSLTKICLFHHCALSKWNVTGALQPPVLNCVTVSVRRRNHGPKMQRSEFPDLMGILQENTPGEPGGSLCSWGRMSPTSTLATTYKKKKDLCSCIDTFVFCKTLFHLFQPKSQNSNLV